MATRIPLAAENLMACALLASHTDLPIVYLELIKLMALAFPQQTTATTKTAFILTTYRFLQDVRLKMLPATRLSICLIHQVLSLNFRSTTT